MTVSNDDDAHFNYETEMKHQWTNVLLIITGLFGLAAGAKAETHREIIVNIPNDFVVTGRTLPAGIYTVSRLSDDRLGGLSIASREQRSGVFVLANHFEDRPAGEAKLSFERIGDMYFLRYIETADGVYTLPLPRFAVLLAKSAHANGMSASGTH